MASRIPKSFSRSLLVATAGASLAACFTAIAGLAAADPSATCGVDLAAPQVTQSGPLPAAV